MTTPLTFRGTKVGNHQPDAGMYVIGIYIHLNVKSHGCGPSTCITRIEMNHSSHPNHPKCSFNQIKAFEVSHKETQFFRYVCKAHLDLIRVAQPRPTISFRHRTWCRYVLPLSVAVILLVHEQVASKTVRRVRGGRRGQGGNVSGG